MSTLRPSKLSGSKLPTVAKGGVATSSTGLLKRPLSQPNLNVDSKKVRSEVEVGAEKSKPAARANTAPPNRPGLAQRTTRGATTNGSTGSNLTRSTSNLSKKGGTTTLNRSNSVSNRPGLASRNAANKAPTMSQKEICEKLLTLEKKMEENAQTINTPLKTQRTALKYPAAKEQNDQLTQEKEALTVESTRYKEEIQGRIEEVGALKREKMDLTAKLEDCQDELSRVKTRLESKTIELENLEKSYQALNSEHRAYKRDMELKEADNKRLSNLLDQERDETKRLNAELAEAIQEKEAAKARMRDNETRLRYIHNQMLELKGNIRVFARIRPVTEEEGESAVATAPEETLTVAKPNPKVGGKPIAVPFQFDRVLAADVPQSDVFEEVEQLVISALDGYNICIFAYGQTGSGKTYTMEGPPGLEFEDESQEVHFGIIPRAIRRVFQLTEERKENGWEYTLGASFIEIYNETIQDLLDKNKKECNIRVTTDPKKGEGVFVENMLSIPVTSVRQIAHLMEKARKHRSVAATKCNERSSRSHCVFQLHITARNSINEINRESVLNLVDLAGSERVKDSGAEGARFTETKNINSSLTQLSTVMMSLGNKAAHIPYRNSKLTHLLSTSLGGNSKTLMIVNVSPAAVHVSETINSLKFAQKVNEVHIGPASKNNK